MIRPIHIRSALVLTLCLALALTLAGCLGGAEEAQDPAESGDEPAKTTEAETGGSPNEGLPIADISDKTTAGANADRPLLLEAAHAATGLPGDFYVWQLYTQGTTAVGDLQERASATRLLVVFEHDGTAWSVVHQEPFLDASEAALLTAVPAVSTELAERVDFVVPVPVDAFYTANVANLASIAAASGVPTAMYAPTRLPEGFTLASTEADYTITAEYRNGDARLLYYALIIGDYGEDAPELIFDNLRFGDLPARMDSSFPFLDGTTAEGPHLTAGESFQALCGSDLSPGMVAAVAQSMVRVE